MAEQRYQNDPEEQMHQEYKRIMGTKASAEAVFQAMKDNPELAKQLQDVSGTVGFDNVLTGKDTPENFLNMWNPSPDAGEMGEFLHMYEKRFGRPIKSIDDIRNIMKNREIK